MGSLAVGQVQRRDSSSAARVPSVSPGVSRGMRRSLQEAEYTISIADAITICCPSCGKSPSNDAIVLDITIGADAHLLLLPQGTPLETVVDDVKKILVAEALEKADGVQTKAASLLSLKYSTFYALVRRIGTT